MEVPLVSTFATDTLLSTKVFRNVSRLPSALTLGSSTQKPDQLVIRLGISRGCPVRLSTRVSQRLQVFARRSAGSGKDVIILPSGDQLQSAKSYGMEIALTGVSSFRLRLSIDSSPWAADWCHFT